MKLNLLPFETAQRGLPVFTWHQRQKLWNRKTENNISWCFGY